ncbi:MAG TPA: hypothetical protein VGP36_15405 [Mycobacteriales bacterium]|nr:hypothetical protein [Mycobacteriales bacterium]
MTDDSLREALRDLIPDYSGPVDPVPRVFATVRRRRSRQRTLLAVAGSGLVAVLALALPALLVPRGGSGGVPAAAPGAPPGPVPSASGALGSPAPEPPVYPIASGTLAGAYWAVGTVSLGPGARLCAVSDDDLSRSEVVCFDGWKAGAAPAFAVQPLADRGVAVTRVAGIASAATVHVLVRRAGGEPLTLTAKQTATEPDARFFAVVLPGTVAVRSVTALDAAGETLGQPVPDPGISCPPPQPDVACATR